MARFTNIGLHRKNFVQSSAQEESSRQHQPERQRDDGWAGRGRGGRGGFGGRGRGGPGGRGGRGGKRGAYAGAERKGWGRDPDIAKRAAFAAERADARRAKRAEDRDVNTTCFACRGTGHAARDCPNILAAAEGANGSAAMLEADALARKAGLVGGESGQESEREENEAEEEEEEGKKGKAGKKDKSKGKKEEKLTGGQITGGKCYRCNSSAHNLHNCPAPVDPENPTPFATCFVCLGTGHLSAACPKNPRGVYINGGACKICHSVAHRAKDCPTQRPEREVVVRGRPALVLGTGEGAGADEDDFMVTRRTATPGEAKGKREKHLPAKNSARGLAKRPGEEGWYEQEAPVVKKKKVVSF